MHKVKLCLTLFFLRKDDFMFDVATDFMVQLVNFIPFYIVLYFIFDMIGSLMFRG